MLSRLGSIDANAWLANLARCLSAEQEGRVSVLLTSETSRLDHLAGASGPSFLIWDAFLV